MYNFNASMAPRGIVPTAAGLDPPALARGQRGWTWWLGGAVSVAILVAVLWQVRDIGIAGIAAMVPRAPLFWAAFLAAYFSAPLVD